MTERELQEIDTQTLLCELIERVKLSNCLEFDVSKWEELKQLLIAKP